jgi:hypothetical protein
VCGHLGQDVAGAVDEQRWPSERANTVSAALINPPAPSLITSSGGLRPRWVSSSRKSFQASVDSLPPGASATNTGLPSVELVLDRLTHPRHRRLAQRCFGAQRIRQRRLDITNPQAADEPGDDQRLQRVRLGHPGANSREAKRSVAPRSLGRCTVTGPAVVLIVVGQ